MLPPATSELDGGASDDRAMIRLLGSIDITIADRVHQVPGIRRKAVLARLALQRGSPVTSTELVDAVWGGRAPSAAHNALQAHVSQLRHQLPEAVGIAWTGTGYALEMEGDATDVQVLERILREANRVAPPAEQAGLFRTAASLFRGAPLMELRGLPWFDRQAAWLEQIRVTTTVGLGEARLRLGEHAQLVLELRRLVADHPLDEDFVRLLMLALYQNGQHEDALSTFRAFEQRLDAAGGGKPNPGVLDLLQMIANERRHASSDPPPERPPSSLLERTDEIAAIEGAFSRLRHERLGSVLIFEGPPGIGKTSIVRYACRVAQAHGARIALARCSSLEQDFAWGLARQLLKAIVLDDATQPMPLSAIDAAHAIGLPTDHAEPLSPSAPGQYALLHSLYMLISDHATASPMLLAVDDLHLADMPSARLLAYLAARVDDLPIVVIAVLRPRFDRLDQVLSGMPQPVRLVEPLSSAGSAQLLTKVMGRDVSDAVAARCYELTGGNPFLLKELGKHLAAGDDDGREALIDSGVPNIGRYVQLQLGELAPRIKRIAEALAIVGDDADPAMLASLTSQEAMTAIDALATLKQYSLVTSRGTPEAFSFAHPLIQSAVYDAIRGPERVRMHAQSAKIMMEHGDVVRAAAHLLRVPPGATQSLEVAPILVKAAGVGLDQGSVDTAVAHLRRYLQEDLGDEHLPALVRLGLAEMLVDADAAAGHLSAALNLVSDSALRSELQLALVGCLNINGRSAEAIKICETTLAQGDTLTANIKHALQAALAWTPLALTTGRHLAHVLDRFRAQHPDATVGGRMLDCVLSLYAAFRNAKAEASARAVRAVSGDVLLGNEMAVTALSCAFHTMNFADVPELPALLDEHLRRARRTGSLRGVAPLLYQRAGYMFANGDLAEAVADDKACLEAAQASGVTIGVAFLSQHLIKALLLTGKAAEAQRVMDLVRSTAAPDVAHWVYSEGEIELLLDQGRVETALGAIRSVGAACEALDFVNPLVCNWRSQLVRCLLMLGRADEARAAAEQAMPFAETWRSPRTVGPALRALAMAETEDRLMLLADSVEMLRKSPARLELAQSELLMGQALAKADFKSDARAHLQNALDLADMCGAVTIQERCTNAMRLIGARPRKTNIKGLHALTPGELRVARLAADGLSNREIAQELYVTVKTVEVHLSNSFRKLGIGRRRDLKGKLESTEP